MKTAEEAGKALKDEGLDFLLETILGDKPHTQARDLEFLGKIARLREDEIVSRVEPYKGDLSSWDIYLKRERIEERMGRAAAMKWLEKKGFGKPEHSGESAIAIDLVYGNDRKYVIRVHNPSG